MTTGLYWTAAQIAAMDDALLIEELLVALALDVDARPLTSEVLRRGIVAQASARAIEKSADERRRLEGLTP